jgi:YHS domain-containing protein
MRQSLLAIPAAFLLAIAALTAQAGNQLAVAISGYDPVTFHEGTPTPGEARLNHFWNGGVWYFASEANRDRFRANPAAFAPAYDGYCAWAASQGYKAPGDPAFWRIVDGTLYLQVSARAQENWLQDVPGHIVKANENWPRIHPF